MDYYIKHYINSSAILLLIFKINGCSDLVVFCEGKSNNYTEIMITTNESGQMEPKVYDNIMDTTHVLSW